MCLTVNTQATLDWMKQNKNKKTVKVYKVLRCEGRTLRSPLRRSHTWKAGTHIAKDCKLQVARRRQWERTNLTYVNEGYHVFLTKRGARAWANSRETVVTLTVSSKDLIAVGYNNTAVFKTVTLSKISYNRLT